jgi:hypothetical protein
VEVCAEKEAGGYRECGSDSDCYDGVCSIGDGSVRLNGKIDASGAQPGYVSVLAAGDIAVLQEIHFFATVRDFDGGYLELESGKGAIQISAALRGSGGGLSQGGETDMLAATDITVGAPIDVNGGDFDGGFVQLYAGRDVRIQSDILASSTAGAGLGGEIDTSADRDIVISSLSQLLTNGHTSADNFGGDGGPQSYYAGRDVNVAADVVVEADGALPDGFGEDVYFEAGRDMSLAGAMSARGRGAQGAGGVIATEAGGTLQIAPTGILDVSSGAGGAGAVELYANGDITHAGLIDGRAASAGPPDSVLIVSDADLVSSGDVLIDGGPVGAARGDIELEGCRVNLQAGTLSSNLGGQARRR